MREYKYTLLVNYKRCLKNYYRPNILSLKFYYFIYVALKFQNLATHLKNNAHFIGFDITGVHGLCKSYKFPRFNAILNSV